jgi:hypothetical protein
LPALNEGSVFVLGIWIGHGEEVDEDHMVTLQIVLTTVDKEWIFVPRLALPQQQTIIADEQPADAAPLESVKAAALSGGDRRTPAPNRGTRPSNAVLSLMHCGPLSVR